MKVSTAEEKTAGDLDARQVLIRRYYLLLRNRLLIRDHVQGKAGPQQAIRKRHNAGFPVESRSLSDSPTTCLKPRVNRREVQGAAVRKCSFVSLWSHSAGGRTATWL